MGEKTESGSGFNSFEKTLLFCLALISLITICDRVLLSLERYPHGYEIQELMISWAGGLVRRGLIGELLSYIADSPHLIFYIIAIFLAIYCGWYVVFIRILHRTFSFFWFIILLGSPSIGAFIFHARGGMLRKDIFIYIYLVLTFWLICKLDTRKKYILILLGFIFLYVPFFLVHELTLFYSGFAFLLFWNLYSDRTGRKVTFLCFFLLGICSVLFAYYFSGTLESREAIYQFWEHRIPDFRAPYAWMPIDYIGLGLFEKPDQARSINYLTNLTQLPSLIFGFLLTFGPVFGVFHTYRFHYVHQKLFGSASTWFFYLLASVSFGGLVVIMNDFGRIFSDFALYLILYLASILAIAEKSGLDVRPRLAFNVQNPITFLFTFCYLFLWKIEIWIPMEAKTWLSIQVWQSLLLGSQ